MELILICTVLLLAALVYFQPLTLIPSVLIIFGLLMGDMSWSIAGKSFSLLGLYVYPSILILAFLSWPSIKKVFTSREMSKSTSKCLAIFAFYLFTVLVPEFYSYLQWGEINPLTFKHIFYPSFSLLFIFIDIEKISMKRLIFVFAIVFFLILIVSFPQAIDFFISTGGRGLGRFRGYTKSEAIFNHIGIISVGFRHHLFQINLIICLLLVVLLPSFYGFVITISDNQGKYKKNILFIASALLVSILFFLNQYAKQVLFNGLVLCFYGTLGLIFYRKVKNNSYYIKFFVVGILATWISLSFDKEVKDYVKENFEQLETRLDEDDDFYLNKQFLLSKGLFDSYSSIYQMDIHGLNRFSIYYMTLRNWAHFCLLGGCGPRGYRVVEYKGKSFKIRTNTFHSTIIDSLTGYGLVFGTIRVTFYFSLLLIPLFFQAFKRMSFIEFSVTFATLISFFVVILIEEVWSHVPHLRLATLSLIFVLVRNILEPGIIKNSSNGGSALWVGSPTS